MQTQTYAEIQRDILSLIARDQPQAEVLEAICLMVEVLEPDVFCSILLLDRAGLQLHTAAAPSLHHALSAAVNGTALGPKAASFGASVYRRERVVAEDIAKDPLWENLCQQVPAHELRACWSQPLLAPDGQALGTLNLYRKQPGAPNSVQIEYLETAAKLATICLMRNRDRLTLLANEQHFRSLFTFNNDAVFSFDFNGHFRQVNVATLELTGLSEAQLLNQHFACLIVSEDLEHTEQHFKAACRGFAQRFETRIQDSRGKRLQLDVCCIPIIVDEQIVGVFGIAEDITERELMTKALQQALLAADRRAVQLRALNEVAIACGRMLNRQALIDYLLSQADRVIDAQQVVLMLADASTMQTQSSVWSSAQISNATLTVRQLNDAQLLQRLNTIKEPVCLSQQQLDESTVFSDLAAAFSRCGIRALNGLILVPLIDSSSVTIGALLLSSKQQEEVDPDDLVFALQFAQMAVATLENIRLINEVVSGEDRLKSQLAFTSAITDSMSEGLVAVDATGCITFVNPAAERLLSADEQDVLGQPLAKVLPIDCAGWHLQNPDAIYGEFNLLHNGVRTLRYEARTMPGEVGHAGWVVALDDVTAKRQGELAMRERNQFFELSLEMFCIINLCGELVQVNPAFAGTLLYREEELIGQPYMPLVHAADLPLISEAVEQLQSGHLIRELTIRAIDREQGLHWLQLSAALSEGQVIYCSARDITEQKESEQQLHLFKRSLESSYNGVVIVDALAADQPIIYVNDAFMRITGYGRDEIVGRNCRFLQRFDRNQAGVSTIRQGLASGSDVHVVLRNYRKDGSQFWNDLYISPVLGSCGTVTHFVGVQNDISEERRYQDQLTFNASHDVLTGLPNRALFEDRLVQSCQVSQRFERCIAVMFIDLDGFKQVNDSYGHHFGDLVLQEVAKRLSEQIRPGDTVARIGGDEFVVLLADLAREEDVVPITERILFALSQPYSIDGSDFHTSASIGITLNDGRIDNPMQLTQQADMAMYKAKQEGRNNYQWFTNDLSQNVQERASLRAELQKAIEEDAFELYYQPQIDCSSGQVLGMEALIRWRHETRGFISPMTFISVAEETGQIIPISLWVLNTACRQARQLADLGMSWLTVAVNISPVHFRRKGFLDSIMAALKNSGLNPKQLELEVTESVLLHDTDRTIEALQKLRGLGIGIAIDDFGTGYSSLSYLKRLPISKVKIDRSFITDILTDSDDAAITQGIISMAHHLRVKVIAEGIETHAQGEFLKKADCDSLQGYYFARPMPFAELLVFLTAGGSEG